jgi:hypothetical protein
MMNGILQITFLGLVIPEFTHFLDYITYLFIAYI